MNASRPLAKDAAMGVWQPDVILPSQYRVPRPTQAPEQRLMIAVLQDAVDCVEKYRLALDYRGRRAFSEAMEWLLAEDIDWPFSFECICGVLDLNPNAVRERVCATAAPQTSPSVMPHEPPETSILALLKSAALPAAVQQPARMAPSTADRRKACCITQSSSSSLL